jgi:hypothetical protein
MEPSYPLIPPLKSALFVDFDNIYIALSKTDPQAAERFASDPARWLAWLEQGQPSRSPEHTPPLARQRSILVRRCYPNPDAGFRRFRSFFTSAAFSVIDCPTMTRTGKNSSDIYMVMDILDTLNHKTHFDEFIILSGDSDFMPVLLRLRAHDRRTTTLAIDFMPPAFRAACDMVISEEEFIEDALGISHDAGFHSGNGGYASGGLTVVGSGSATIRSRVPAALLKEMAARVYAAVCGAGEVAGASLPEILKDFREFRESTNWLGFGTSQRLAEALIASEPRIHLERINPMMYKILLNPESPAPLMVAETVPAVTAISPKGKASAAKGRPNRLAGKSSRSKTVRPSADVETALPAQPADAVAAAPSETARSGESQGEAYETTEKNATVKLRETVLDLVKEVVKTSPSPLLLARVSQIIVSKIGHQVIDTQWAGAGSFKRLLQGAEDLGLEITTQPEPGYIFDPELHDNPIHAEENEEEQAPIEESQPSLEEFIRRVSRVTGAPDLSPQDYALVFHGIIEELQQISEGAKAYNTYQSAKAISDWCAECGSPISRGNIMLVLKGIIFQDGPRFSKRPGSYNASELAAVVQANIKALCRRSRMEFSEYEERLLEEWILGGLDKADQNAGSEEPEAVQKE